jgi:hypothetical protein
MKALLIYPTHENCREVEEFYVNAGIDAATYPGRTTIDTETISQNCWNLNADRAEAIGLPVVKTICPNCPSRTKCLACGYLEKLIRVEESTVALATQKRAEYSGLANLSSGREYVSVHENPIDMLRPAVSISEQDLLLVARITGRMVNEPSFLDWFGNDLRIDDEGNRYRDQEQAIRRDRQYRFCLHLIEMIDDLVQGLRQAEHTTEWQPSKTMKCPTGMERTLYFATQISKALFEGQAWRFILAAAAGELESAAIIVSKRFIKTSGRGNAFPVKSICGFKSNLPAIGATTWFNDATLSPDRLKSILHLPVHDMTPGGQIEYQRKCVQILRDITRRTSSRIFANIIRGVLVDRPDFQRIGVICLRPHIDALRDLGADFQDRIVKSTYFGSGDDRSSNDWYKRCDLIVIAGTPRIPPSSIAEYLVQVGETIAACQQPEWKTIYWEGKTESGEFVRVKARGYQDETWRRAHRDLVRAQLVQAIGRGRGILQSGCEVLVLSTEECGLVISDAELEPLSGASANVLDAIHELTITFANKFSLGKVIVRTDDIARYIGLSVPRVRQILRALERRGLVQKVGERKGWRLVDHPRSSTISVSVTDACATDS